MGIPTRTREYRLPTKEGPGSLVIQEADVTALRSDEVLVKVMAVSLQVRTI